MVARLTMVALCLSLCGCATANRCAGFSAIRTSKADKLTDETAWSILAHNRFGQSQGCW